MRALHRLPAAPTTFAAALFGAVIGIMPEHASAQMRVEVRPFETVTLSTQQFLTGDKNGKPAMLAGELRIPKPGSERLPAVILIHGSGGVGRNVDGWATEINSLGGAVFITHTF